MNDVVPLHQDSRFRRFRSDPVRLNLRNAKHKLTVIRGADGDDDEDPEICPFERLRRRRRWNTLLFDVDDEESRVDERHPLVSLNVALVRQWCLMNLLDFHDVNRTFSS